MPRPKTHTRKSIASAAMDTFWQYGYEATSLNDLVRQTGASRQSIYADFGGKLDLFLASLDCYQTEVVTPAFAQVEQRGADLSAVEAYFWHQIERAESAGLPGPGCLIANTMTENAAHDLKVSERVTSHNNRLQAGFLNAFRGEYRIKQIRIQEKRLEVIAATTVIFAQGLWSYSRAIDNSQTLKRSVAHYLQLVSRGEK